MLLLALAAPPAAIFSGPAFSAPAALAAPEVTAPLPSLDPHAGETPAQRDVRMKWFREARFGMFIHWGLYAIPAGQWKGKAIGGIGEWIMNSAKIPVAEYAALAPQWNPTRFDAEAWAQLAQDAGMKYLVITSKHHDGFALFPSKASPFNVAQATPWKRDPLDELAAACRKRGIRFGLYYSQAQDWSHPGGAAYNGHWDEAQKGDLNAYVQKIAAPQVAEILTKYQPDVLWWDTPVEMSRVSVQALTKEFPKYPRLIANNRLGNGVAGDTETPEQFIPATGFPGRDWETCMTMNDTWGYKSDDNNYKSVVSLTRNLIDIASKGGNYLLNVGPDATGTIPAPQVERLREIGAWLKRNGDGIYATTASPYKRLGFEGRATVRGNSLFLHVFSWPGDSIVLRGLQTPLRRARLVTTGDKVQVLRMPGGALRLYKPAQTDPISTTIELQLAAPPQVLEPELVLSPDENGRFGLSAPDATLEGASIKTEGNPANIGYWTNAADTVSWKLEAPVGGRYTVKLEYACEPGSEGSTFRLEVDGRASGIEGTVAATRSWTDYTSAALPGTLELGPGRHTLRLKPMTKPGSAVMNLRRLWLEPAAP